MSDYVLGLDWLSGAWAFCKLQIVDNMKPEFGKLSSGDLRTDLIRQARHIVLDAPIGLLSQGKNKVAQDRQCDKGAKAWIGTALQYSVTAPVYKHELQLWRNNKRLRAKQLGGNLRGLIPMIDSAARIRKINASTLESHPELAFAALIGKPLPASAAKATLLGMLSRLGILAARCGVSISMRDLSLLGRVSTDNYLDAAIMAIIARDWEQKNDVFLIRGEHGHPDLLSRKPGNHNRLMALPHHYTDSRHQNEATLEEMKDLALQWKDSW